MRHPNFSKLDAIRDATLKEIRAKKAKKPKVSTYKTTESDAQVSSGQAEEALGYIFAQAANRAKRRKAQKMKNSQLLIFTVLPRLPWLPPMLAGSVAVAPIKMKVLPVLPAAKSPGQNLKL
ncbi:hypothetical protein [Candidatus Methylobacter favarea]|uniref:hypothetical protein n=1 Tax=Candidatus Methylobacter favarea TaxID=2707345 RepID=UPI00157BC511|nr:hypothetical protein [Candidatus Methylobacter favarea]